MGEARIEAAEASLFYISSDAAFLERQPRMLKQPPGMSQGPLL
jgi:hypothetical protein